MPLKTGKRWCPCEQPVPSGDPRSAGTCLKCGKYIRLLPEHVEDMFDDFAELLEDAGKKPRHKESPELQVFRLHTLQRVRAGQHLHGEKWRAKDMCREGREEFSDAFVYAVSRLAQGKGDRSLVMTQMLAAYEGYEAAVRDEQKEKGIP